MKRTSRKCQSLSGFEMRGLLFAIFLILLVSGSVANESAFVESSIEDALDTQEEVRVIVVLNNDDERPGLTVAEKKDIREQQEEVVEQLSFESETVELQSLSTSPILTGSLTQYEIDFLADLPEVEAIYLSKMYHIELTTSVPAINVDDVWGIKFNGTNITGAGQSICVIDTGIALTHTAFTGKIVDQKCYCSINTSTLVGCCQNATESTNATDDHGHGTHVAGIAMGNGGGVIGVAKEASVVAVKVCNSAGSCDGADIALGIDYCINKSAQYNISAISISLSDSGNYATQSDCPNTNDALMDEAVANGIVVAVASGNDGYTTGIGDPSCEINATSVGATVRDGTSVASYSNRGPLLDVMAPGSSIISAALGGGTTSNSGTSMATPHVSGLVALLAQNARLRNKTFNPVEIEQILEDTSMSVSGFRQVNAFTALNRQSYNLTYNATNNSLSSGGTIFFRNSSLNQSLFGECFNISSTNITLRDQNENCTSLNQSATVRLNVTSRPNAIPRLNGVTCGNDCQNRTFNNGLLTFDVIHFSSYTAGSNLSLSIIDDTDNESRFINDQVRFSANLTNTTNATNTTDGACQIKFNTTGTYGSFNSMTFNSSRNRFEYNRTFTPHLNGTYNITCGSYDETLSLIDAFEIKNDTIAPIVSISSPTNGSTENTVSAVTFTYTVADNSTISNCSITLSDGNSQNVTSVAKNTSQTFSVSVNDATYYWNVTCFDVNGLSNISTTYSFTKTTPAVSNNGGGGGGGGGSCTSLCAPIGFMSCAGYSTVMCGDFNGDRCTESKLITCPKGEWCQAPTGCVPMPCFEEWMCNDWTACENGKQTRSCTEMNVCGTEELKPIVEQQCVSAVTEQPRKLYSIANEPPIEVIESPPSPNKELAFRAGAGALLVLSLGGYLFWRFVPRTKPIKKVKRR